MKNSEPFFRTKAEFGLPGEEAQLLNTHVGGCEECREKLALMNAVQHLSDDAGAAR